MSLRVAAGVLGVASLTVGDHMAVEARLGTLDGRHLGMLVDPSVGVRHLDLVAGLAVLLRVVTLGARLAAPARLDVAAALANVGGSQNLYEQVLRTFLKHHTDEIVKLRGKLADGALDDAARMAHTLQGVAATLGARRLTAAATALYDALSGGDVRPPAESLLAEAEQALAATVSAFERQLRQSNSKGG